MKIINRTFFAFTLLAPAAAAQQYEVGALGGFGVAREISITNPNGSASTGFKNGFVLGAFAGSNDYRFFSGETSYLYRRSDLKVSSGNREATLEGHTQFVDFRVLLHLTHRSSPLRPFVSLGGGGAFYSGTGKETASQPLNSFVGLTNTMEAKPMVTGGVGVKVRMTEHVGLRLEFRDYVTPFPDRLLAPAPGSSSSGWLHNFMPLIAVAARF